jgi:hypothetical protein
VEAEDLERLIGDVRRVMKNGGYLLLKEHNCISDELCRLIDIGMHGDCELLLLLLLLLFYFVEHVLYGISRSTFSNPGNYRCTNGWKKLLAKFGFHMIKEYARYNEPTNSYFSLYILNKPNALEASEC